jgi:hypothetical protein
MFCKVYFLPLISANVMAISNLVQEFGFQAVIVVQVKVSLRKIDQTNFTSEGFPKA